MNTNTQELGRFTLVRAGPFGSLWLAVTIVAALSPSSNSYATTYSASGQCSSPALNASGSVFVDGQTCTVGFALTVTPGGGPSPTTLEARLIRCSTPAGDGCSCMSGEQTVATLCDVGTPCTDPVLVSGVLLSNDELIELHSGGLKILVITDVGNVLVDIVNDTEKGPPGCVAIPAFSEWGLIILALALLAAGTILIRHQGQPRSA
ncbi:MAG: hypothetical protein O7A69_06735 [SAR324 cluster bacterium]|nr:hypothetical protein [SAR324 cluster bacterium]